jgi:hypothetical protein
MVLWRSEVGNIKVSFKHSISPWKRESEYEVQLLLPPSDLRGPRHSAAAALVVAGKLQVAAGRAEPVA